MFISVECVRWVFDGSRSKGNARNVLLALAACCNEEGYSWPGMELLVQWSNSSVPTVVKALDELKELGEVVIERGGKGPGDFTRYQLKGFMDSRVKKGKEEAPKGKIEDGERVKPSKSPGIDNTQLIQVVTEENASIQKTQNKKYLEEERTEEALPLKQEERKAIPKPVKEPKARRGFEKTSPRPVAAPRVVTNKQPESWIWFSTIFKHLSDVNAYDHPDMFLLVDEMLAEIEREEAEERLSIFIDGSEKISGYLAKSFLMGGWRTINPEEHRLPRIVSEGILRR